MWGSNPSLHMEKLQVLSSLPVVGYCEVFTVRSCPCLSYPFSVVFFVFLVCVIPRPDFRFFFSEEILPYVAVALLGPWEKVSSGSSYITISNQSFISSIINLKVNILFLKELIEIIYNYPLNLYLAT